VIALVCLILFGLLQVALLYSAREALQYSAGRGLRARTVGFNRFMVFKTVRIGSIPAAGRILEPVAPGSPTQQYNLEAARIPLYLDAENYDRLPAILDYEDWPTIDHSEPLLQADGTLRMTVAQRYPLRLPFHRAFHEGDVAELGAADPIENYLEQHFDLYMTDEGW
jgi:hypothetical protein